jgi:hypothetical protein
MTSVAAKPNGTTRYHPEAESERRWGALRLFAAEGSAPLQRPGVIQSHSHEALLVLHHVETSRDGSTSILEELIAPSAFQATQGLALSENGQTLYVADYATGLWAVDIASKQLQKLEAPAGTWVFGLDGLSRVRNGLIALQIGAKPERVLRLQIDPNGTHITKVEILEMNHPDYEGPIQGTIAGMLSS